MSLIDLKYVPENAFITNLNEKIAELLRNVSGSVAFKNPNETQHIINAVVALKTSISVLKKQAEQGVPNGEQPITLAQVMEDLRVAHKVVMAEVIPVSGGGGATVDLTQVNQDISNLQQAVAQIPTLPSDFISSWSTTKAAAAKIPSTFTSTIFNDIKAGVDKIPSTFTKTIFEGIKASADKIPSTFDANTLATMKAATDKIPSAFTSSSLTEINSSIVNVIQQLNARDLLNINDLQTALAQAETNVVSVVSAVNDLNKPK
jgi:hypothetical protein